MCDLANLPFALYGRALGVNWVYLLFQLGYESIWAIALPIQLTELIFPTRRDDPWLSRWGLAIVAVVFLLASIATWYLFRLAIPKFIHGPAYRAWFRSALRTLTSPSSFSRTTTSQR